MHSSEGLGSSKHFDTPTLAALCAAALGLGLALVGATGCDATATASATPLADIKQQVFGAPESATPCPIDLATGVRCIAERAGPSVVSVRVAREAKAARNLRSSPFEMPFEDFERVPRGIQRSQGSGVAIRADGYIVTNAHVVDGADRVEVELSDGTIHQATVLGSDPKFDIAVIKVEGATSLPHLLFADSDAVGAGDFVLAIGSPFGLDHSISFGVVSAIGRGDMGIVDYENFIQTDAAINPGNSGGALVNSSGQLIGINTAILSRSGASAGVGFAVPSNLVRDVSEQIIADGKVARGYLGVSIQDVTADLSKALSVRATRGAVVGSVEGGTPAATAGLKSGDVVTGIDGEPVRSSRDLRLRIARQKPGTRVSLTIERGSKNLELTAVLGELSEAGQAASPESMDVETPTAIGLQLGTSADGRVVVERIEPGSAAADAGLRPGDIVTEIGRQAVGSATELANGLSKLGETPTVLTVERDGRAHFVVLRKR